ncbi:hypothetical protein GCM10027361_19430 [Erwinia aphidicola]
MQQAQPLVELRPLDAQPLAVLLNGKTVITLDFQRDLRYILPGNGRINCVQLTNRLQRDNGFRKAEHQKQVTAALRTGEDRNFW